MIRPALVAITLILLTLLMTSPASADLCFTSPFGMTHVRAGDVVEIGWQSSPAIDVVNLWLVGNFAPRRSPHPHEQWFRLSTIAEDLANTGRALWTVPFTWTIPPGAWEAGTYSTCGATFKFYIEDVTPRPPVGFVPYKSSQTWTVYCDPEPPCE
jgi:hypothetical protein